MFVPAQLKANHMELQLHNVETISIQSFDKGVGRETDDHYKVIRIKINGWQNVITLYCKDDVRIDVPKDEYPKTSVTAWQDDLAAWQDDGGEG
jgi:hypothetical protein